MLSTRRYVADTSVRNLSAASFSVLSNVKNISSQRKGSEEFKAGLGAARSKVNVDKSSTAAWGKTSVPVRAELNELAAALWHFNSSSNFEISGDVARKIEVTGDEMKDQGFLEATVERRQTMRSKRFIQSKDCVFRSKVQMHRIDDGTIILTTTSDHTGADSTTTTSKTTKRRKTSTYDKVRGGEEQGGARSKATKLIPNTNRIARP